MTSLFETGCLRKLFERSFSKTISCTGLDPKIIEGVVLCAGYSNVSEVILAEIVKSQVTPRYTRYVSGMGCSGIVAGIELACELVRSRPAEPILLVGVEAFAPKTREERFLSYALLSDAVVTAVVSAVPGELDHKIGLEILACRGMAVHPTSGTADTAALRLSSTAVIRERGFRTSDIANVFGNNIFLPAKIIQEAFAGFSNKQMFLDNVPRIGHCGSCDSLINMQDSLRQEPGLTHVLLAHGDRHSSAVLLRNKI